MTDFLESPVTGFSPAGEVLRQEGPATVYLVGAGSGDEGLLTLRARELLGRADAIVYDALANPAFLEPAKEGSQAIYVGKRPGEKSWRQEEINALLVRLAREGKTVVRLKGGDPFVFGRGGEEALALEAAGIPYQLVPGVTSAVAALESAGIPVTHRELARSFTVITGHLAEEAPGAGKDGAGQEKKTSRFTQYAAIEGSLVFLMGVAALPDIAAALLAGGRKGETPVAIVEWGSTLRERRINASLATVARVAEQEKVQNPAVICVGEVAAFDFRSRLLPLAKKRIAVTGTAAITAKLSGPLKDGGALVYPAPYMALEPNPALSSLLPPLESIGWLVFTSANGVHCFFDYLLACRCDLRALSRLRFCVVGKGSSAALAARGFKADYLPERYTVADMARGFAKLWLSEKSGAEAAGAAGKEQAGAAGPATVCVLRAHQGSADLQAVFDQEGIPYRDIPLYRLSVKEGLLEGLFTLLDKLDYLTFASSSGARAFFERYAQALASPDRGDRQLLSPACSLVCIGEKTGEEAAAWSRWLSLANPVLIAESYTAEGIIHTILGDIKK